MYQTTLRDKEVLLKEALEFAKEARYREALVQSERDVSNRQHNLIHKRFDELRLSSDGHAAVGLDWNSLPRFDPTHVPKTKWLVEEFIPRSAISLLFGERGSYKSTLVLLAARCVANEEEFLGRDTKGSAVLYLDYENPPDAIKRLDADLGLGLAEESMFILWDRFGKEPIPRPGSAVLLSLAKQYRGALWIIFDSWSSLLEEGEGGETTGQISPIYKRLRALADLGATITVLDHSRKYLPDIIYGGGDKEAKADVIHNLTTFEDKIHPHSTIVKVESFLKRYAPKGVGGFAVRISGRRDEEGTFHIKDIQPCADPPVEERKRKRDIIRQLIKHNPGASKRQIANLAMTKGLGRDEAREILEQGVGKHWEVEIAARGRKVIRLIL